MLEIALRYGLNAQASMTAPARLRRWFMPLGTAALMLADFYWGGLNGPTALTASSGRGAAPIRSCIEYQESDHWRGGDGAVVRRSCPDLLCGSHRTG